MMDLGWEGRRGMQGYKRRGRWVEEIASV